MRQSVEKIYLLGFGYISRTELDLQHDQIKPFLGSLPKLVKSKKCLLVEGEEDSIDGALYRWILEDDEIDVIPVGGSIEVSLAASRDGLWRGLSDRVELTGVIDRDYKKDDFETDNCYVLPYHEAESIIAHPDIVLALQHCLSNTEKVYTRDELIDILCEEASSRVMYVALQRTFVQLVVNFNISAKRSVIAAISSPEAAAEYLYLASNKEIEKVQIMCDASKIEEIIKFEMQRCHNAIEQRNVDELLKLFEGKRFLKKMANISGCATPLGMIKAIKKHLRKSDYPVIAAISIGIKSNFASSPSVADSDGSPNS